MKGINLLKKKEIESIDELRTKKLVYFSAIIGTLTVISMGLIVFYFSLDIRRKAEELNALEKSWTDNISSYSEVESYALAVSQKLSAIKDIKSQVDFYGIISWVNEQVPSGLSLSSIRFGQDGTLAMNGDTADSASLLQFFDNLVSKRKDDLKTVLLESIDLSKEGVYRFSLAIKFSKFKESGGGQ